MQGTRHLLLVGPEPLRRHLRGRGEHLLVDANEDDPVAGVRGAGLFTSSVRVVHGEVLDAAGAQRLADAISGSPFPVLVEAEKLHAAAEKRFAAVCDVVKLSLEKDGRQTITRIASALSLELEASVTSLLLERLSHDPGRLVGVLEALASGGFTRPSAAQVKLLAGSSRAEGLPWHLLDALEQGRAVDDVVERLDPIPSIAFLAKRIRLVAHMLENPGLGREDVHESFGNVSENAWRQTRRLGERLGRERCSELLGVLAAADVHAKRGRGRAALVWASGAVRAALLTNDAS